MQITEAQFEDLLPLYVLGALEPDELEAMEAYIAEHPQAQRDIAEAQQVAALLAWTPPQQDPPPALRERVLARARSEQPATPLARASMWERVRNALRPPGTRAGLALSAALLATTLFFGARTVQVQQQVQQQQALIDMFESPNMQVASLVPPDASTGARLQMAFDPNGHLAQVVVSNLPQLPASQTYQFWLIGEQPVSGGLFRVDERGVGSFVVESDTPLGQYESIGVSREPAGGSDTPTTDQILLLGDLSPPQ
jgi:anti-sigma-K factor RskA